MTKYLVVEKSNDYNDEYYSFNESGYEIASKLYSTKEDAKNIGMKEAILSQFRGGYNHKTKSYGKVDSSYFDFKKFGEYGETDRLEEYFKKKGYPFDEDDYELTLPKGLSEGEILEAWKHYDVGLFDIIEIEED